jgi:Dolichyl-phosphate-mannose-protein mannosyltransferase
VTAQPSGRAGAARSLPGLPGALWTGLTLALALGVVAASRVPSLDVLVWNVDEGITGAMADIVRAGGIPYRDGVDHRGPLTYYAYALVFALRGGSGADRLWAIHVALIVVVGLVVLFTYLLGSRAFDRRTGALGALLVACLSSALPPRDTLAFHTEWTLLLLSTPAALCCVLALRGERVLWLLLGGALFGLAFLAKQPAGLELAAAASFFVLRNLVPREGRHWGRAVLEGGVLALGFSAVVGAVVGAFALAGAWPDFVLWFWRYNAEVYVPAVPLADRIRGGLTYWYGLLHTYRLLGVLVGVGVAALAGSWLRRDARPGPTPRRVGHRFEAFLLSWLAGAYLGASLSGRAFGHYSLPLLPAAGVLGAHGLLQLSDALRASLAGRRSPARSLRDAAVAVLLLGALSQQIPHRPAGGWRRIWEIDSERNAAVAELVRYLDSHSGPDDRIFVWGWFASLYTLSDRLPGSRFLYCTFLSGLVPWTNLDDPDTLDRVIPGSWAMLREDLERRRPLYVIDATPGDYSHFAKYPPSAMPQLARLLQEEYDDDGSVALKDGSAYFRLFRRREDAADSSGRSPDQGTVGLAGAAGRSRKYSRSCRKSLTPCLAKLDGFALGAPPIRSRKWMSIH